MVITDRYLIQRYEKNEILGKLIAKGLEAVSKEDIKILKNKWLPFETQNPEISKTEDLLTNEERQWISKQPPLKVANEMNLAPFNFSDKGVPKGYSIDLINIVSEKMINSLKSNTNKSFKS